MDTGARRTGVVARALATTACTTALAAGSHAHAGAGAPSAAPLVLVGCAVLVGALALAHRPLTVLRLLPLVAGAQLLAHATGGPHGTVAVGHLQHAHGATTPAALGDVLRASVTGASSTADGRMLLTHAAAVVATVVLLVGLDRSTVLMLHWWRGVLRLTGPVPLAPPRRHQRPGSVSALGPSVGMPTVPSRRGPPPVLATA